jgi:outer membrane protein OmpA-like peptidoglycan-associated protein
MNKGLGWYAASLLLVVTTVGLTTGCVATRKFVRNEVSTSSNEITATMEEKDRNLQQGIDANSGQISELNGVTRQQGQQIATLDTGLKATDQKAGQAMSVGQGAQSTATQATTHVNRLDQQFQNRNQYTALAEQSVPFAFGSAKIEEDQLGVLSQVAQQVKGNPDAILVLEGRTDAIGDDTYNIQLGEKRLETVVRYLVVEQAVPMQQIYKMSFGEARPIAANDTREGRAQNRSVVLKIMTPNVNASGQIVSDAAPTGR